MSHKSLINHWHQHSLQWSKLDSPLRPCADDLQIYKRYVNDKQNILILGVTPELAELSASAICVDSCGERIQLLWNTNSARNAVQADWLHLPFIKNHFDAVLGDGIFNLLTYPEQYSPLLQNISSQLKPSGIFVSRVFINNEKCQTAEEVCQLAVKSRIGSFHAFKWRFVMALLNERTQTNIPVIDILDAFNNFFPDRKYLSIKSGWNSETINTIDVYQNSPAVYSFPTMSQLNSMKPETFSEETIEYGQYELAEACPVIVWNKING